MGRQIKIPWRVCDWQWYEFTIYWCYDLAPRIDLKVRIYFANVHICHSEIPPNYSSAPTRGPKQQQHQSCIMSGHHWSGQALTGTGEGSAVGSFVGHSGTFTDTAGTQSVCRVGGKIKYWRIQIDLQHRIGGGSVCHTAQHRRRRQ